MLNGAVQAAGGYDKLTAQQRTALRLAKAMLNGLTEQATLELAALGASNPATN